ncbi:histidinol-phosphate transaminase [Homoserinimonas sp. OAct 916]|uniref:histidinol-phosphate transaminase n=1 Tax=Homoserinimonas sp. OAct 916 TaxID=2211450 RepID=UPI000DBEAAD8|nr:histidinol-phosphate transaminase [Homoserinimonas sp. OAct 916]
MSTTSASENLASPLDLVRPDLKGFTGYSSARLETPADASDEVPAESGQPERLWLNANESAWDNPADDAGAARRYPEPQPDRLRRALAELYDCSSAELLACRGSDEAIDLLVRALCAPGGDAIVITPPTFGMYTVSARLNGTRVLEVPQLDEADGLRVDLDAVRRVTLAERARVVFLASPGNPSGASIPLDRVRELALALAGQALVVVDEAYGEFAIEASAVTLLADVPNVAVLRTMSKAHALAGARIGAVIARPELIAVLGRCQAPYPLPVCSVNLACAALEADSVQRTRAAVREAVAGRARLADLLEASPGVSRVYRSDANFVLARFVDAEWALQRFEDQAIVVRDMRDKPGLTDALRISVGTGDALNRVAAVLADLPAEPAARQHTSAQPSSTQTRPTEPATRSTAP